MNIVKAAKESIEDHKKILESARIREDYQVMKLSLEVIENCEKIIKITEEQMKKEEQHQVTCC